MHSVSHEFNLGDGDSTSRQLSAFGGAQLSEQRVDKGKRRAASCYFVEDGPEMGDLASQPFEAQSGGGGPAPKRAAGDDVGGGANGGASAAMDISALPDLCPLPLDDLGSIDFGISTIGVPQPVTGVVNLSTKEGLACVRRLAAVCGGVHADIKASVKADANWTTVHGANVRNTSIFKSHTTHHLWEDVTTRVLGRKAAPSTVLEKTLRGIIRGDKELVDTIDFCEVAVPSLGIWASLGGVVKLQKCAELKKGYLLQIPTAQTFFLEHRGGVQVIGGEWHCALAYSVLGASVGTEMRSLYPIYMTEMAQKGVSFDAAAPSLPEEGKNARFVTVNVPLEHRALVIHLRYATHYDGQWISFDIPLAMGRFEFPAGDVTRAPALTSVPRIDYSSASLNVAAFGPAEMRDAFRTGPLTEERHSDKLLEHICAWADPITNGNNFVVVNKMSRTPETWMKIMNLGDRSGNASAVVRYKMELGMRNGLKSLALTGATHGSLTPMDVLSQVLDAVPAIHYQTVGGRMLFLGSGDLPQG